MEVDEIVARALCRSKQQWGDTAAVTEQYVDVCWRDYLPDAKVAITAYLSARSAEPVAWVPQSHLDFLAEGRATDSPSNALVHDRPNAEMGWIVPLYAHPTPVTTPSPDPEQPETRETPPSA